MVKLLFKTPSKEQPFELDIDIASVTNVEQLKQKVAEHTNSSVPNIKLIHKGIHQQIKAKYSRMNFLSPRLTSLKERPSTLSLRLLNPKRLLLIPSPQRIPPALTNKIPSED
jgi:hypothetical protein